MMPSLASTAPAWLAAIAMLLLKVTLLLGLAWIVAALLRRRSAASRHFVWALAIGAVLVLPILSRVSPRVALPLPTVLGPSQRAIAPSTTEARPGGGATTRRATENQPGSVTTIREPAATEDLAFVRGAEPVTTIAFRWLWLVWLVGVVAVLSRLGLGLYGLRRLARRAEPLDDASWGVMLHESQVRAEVPVPIRLCRSASVGAPITWGWSAPTVLLPAHADAWPLDRRRVVLDHELAHVARRDYVTQLGAALATSVYWFHPLVWYAVRRLRVESEHACDDRVIRHGTSAPDYATHLLAVARAARQLRLAGAVAICMARPSHLEGRLLSLLDDARPRGGLAARTRIAAIASLAVLATLFAGLQPAARAAKPEGEQGSELQVVTNSDPSSTIENSIDAKSGESLTLELETGGNVELRGWDKSEVRVHAELGGADWRDTQFAMERERGGVRVTSKQVRHKMSSSTSHKFTIDVPRKFDLDLNSAGGDVSIAGVEGEFRGSTGGGDLTLERVKGEVRLSTGGGEILVTDTEAHGTVSTGGGLVRMSRVTGGLHGSSGSGPVIYAEADGASSKGSLDGVRVNRMGIEDTRTDAAGMLHIERAGGDVILEEAPHGVEISTGGGEIRVGRAAKSVTAHTGGGDIEIGPVAGSVSADTGGGDVQVTIAEASGEEQTVKISSGSGRIVVELPAGFDGEFDLETAYTRDRGRVTRIDSPWKLEVTTTKDWDDHWGSPRKFVRASGVAGKGRGLVRVRTVNGDIVVKKR